MAITKPPVLPAWADAGDKVQPSNAELSVGWPVSSTPPSRQRFNWVLNYVANAVRYFSRRGLVDYDAAETYMTGDRIIGDDGKTYRSLIDNNTAQTPSTSPTKWERWGFSFADLGSNAQTQATTAFTTAGAAPNFTLTPSPAITAYSSNQRFRAKFHAAGTGADVINVSALGNKGLKQYDTSGAKVAAVIAANQLADIEYDGIDFVILDPLPPTAGVTSVNGGAGVVVVPFASVRQTVLSAPVDTLGLPTFLPATSASLALAMQNVTAGTPLVVTAANGFGANGAIDRIGISTSNLSCGLAANNTNYLYVDIAANGTMTFGATLTPPIYQQGGVPGVANGQLTFNIQQMVAFLGNGATAPQAYRVFIGEAVTNATTVTSTVAYALMGRYETGRFAIATNTSYSKNHNLGVEPHRIRVFGSETTNGVLADPIMYYFTDGGHYLGVRNVGKLGLILTTGSYQAQVVNSVGTINTAVEALVIVERGW